MQDLLFSWLYFLKNSPETCFNISAVTGNVCLMQFIHKSRIYIYMQYIIIYIYIYLLRQTLCSGSCTSCSCTLVPRLKHDSLRMSRMLLASRLVSSRLHPDECENTFLHSGAQSELTIRPEGDVRGH